MMPKNTREIHNYTTFESTKVQWNKLMNFNEPVVKIFCPDLVAVRDTFRSAITIRLIYSVVSRSQGVFSIAVFFAEAYSKASVDIG